MHISGSSPAPVTSGLALLDRPLPLGLRVIFLVICTFLPTAYVAMEYEQHHDLTRILWFGDLFQDHALPEIREMKPVVVAGPGFDGQFYAQMALDPTLRRADMSEALDDPGFRGQRIFLPALAHVLGLGQPKAVIAAYALLNLAFWFLLFFVLLRRLSAISARSFLVFFAIMWNSGTLACVQSALADLPACTLGLISLGLGEFSAALLIALAILTKPTGGLFLLRYLSPFPRTAGELGKKAAVIFIVLIPPLLWQLYLVHLLQAKVIGNEGLIAMPFEGWWHRLVSSVWIFSKTPVPWSSGDALPWLINLFEFLALASLTVQAIFLVVHPRWRQSIWIVGIGFAVLFFCLSDKAYTAQVGYVRSMLPLTMAFNLLLMEIRPAWLFCLLFIAGNVGLVEGIGEMFLYTWFPAVVGG